MNDHLDPLATDLGLELVGGALGDDLPFVDDHDPVGQRVGLLEVLGREQDRRALLGAVPDDVPHVQPAARVETRGGLVEEQHLGMGDEAAGEVEPAAHPARVGLGDPVASVDQTELLQQLGSPLGRCLASELVEPAEHPQVLAAGQVLVDRGELAGKADAAPGRPVVQRRRRAPPRPRGLRRA